VDLFRERERMLRSSRRDKHKLCTFFMFIQTMKKHTIAWGFGETVFMTGKIDTMPLPQTTTEH